MYKKFISVLLTSCLGVTSVYADFSVNVTEQGIRIDGTDDSESGQVSIAVYDRNNQLLYVDQNECGEAGDYTVLIDVPTTEALRIKVGGDGMYSPDMLLSDAKENNQTLYVSKYSAGGDGSKQNPYSTLSEAYSVAGDGTVINVLDRAEWDISEPGENEVTITGGTLSIADVSMINIPLRLESIAVETKQEIIAKRLTVSEGVRFLTPVSLHAEEAYLHSGSYENVSGSEIHLYEGVEGVCLSDCTAVIYEDCASYGKIEDGCDFLVYSSGGGNTKLKDGILFLTPRDGRNVSINNGDYTKSAQISEPGEYRISYEYDFKLHSAKLRNDENGTMVSVDLSAYNRNNNADKVNPVLIAGVYDEQMTLLKMQMTPVTVGDMGNYELPLGKIDTQRPVIKLFMWDSLIGMRPLCEIITEIKTEEQEKTYYVSPQGKENGNGSFAAPFNTIQQAIAAAEESSLPVTIYLRGGEYYITEQISFGEKNNNITIESYENEKAVITTGYKIVGSAFSKANDDISNRVLDAQAREGLLCVSLEQLGIENLGKIYEYENCAEETVMPALMQDGKRMQLCSYPDTGYLNFEDEVSGGDGTNPMFFHINKSKAVRAAQWQGSEIYADGYIQTDWTDSRCRVQITEEGDDYVVTALNNELEITPLAGRRVRFINVIEELSAPGEWYLDRETGMLYIYPYSGFDNSSVITFNPRQETLDSVFKIQNTSQISFKNIDFKHISTKVFSVENSSDIVIEECSIEDIAGYAVKANESKEVMIVGNNICEAGSGVIWISGGDAWKLHKANNYISDNEIYRFSQDARICQPAVQIHGYGTTVRRNKIYDAPHMAIGLAGMGCTIEYNEIYDVCKETADAGAIYGGQYPHLQGNTIRNNYFHDIKNNTGLGYSVNTIYFDDLWGSCDVYSNIFCNVERGVLVGGGRSNRFWNNVFIDCEKSVTIDSRGTMLENYEDHRAYVNLYYSPYRSELWKKEFPKVYSIMEDEPKLPKYNEVCDNIYVNTGSENLQDVAATLTQHTGNIELTPEQAGFIDYENRVFAINSDSAIYQSIPNFVAPDFAEIGIRNTIK